METIILILAEREGGTLIGEAERRERAMTIDRGLINELRFS